MVKGKLKRLFPTIFVKKNQYFTKEEKITKKNSRIPIFVIPKMVLKSLVIGVIIDILDVHFV